MPSRVAVCSRAVFRVVFRVVLAAAMVLGTLAVAAPVAPADAADMAVTRREARPVKSVEVDVAAPRVRHRGCSDRYSCFALYGAYGPYGGVGFWAAYTGWYR